MRRIPGAFSSKRNPIQIRYVSNVPIIRIQNATFYRQYPSSLTLSTSNPPLFPSLDFEIPSFSEQPEHWAILGPSSSGKTTFLEILRGQHFCLPPTARSFPYLSSGDTSRKSQGLPSRAVQYVGFDAKRGRGARLGSRGAYLSARYETRREETDFSLLDYLTGNTSLNPLESSEESSKHSGNVETIERTIDDLRIKELIDMPLENLSNGQTRRAMIAKALISKPEVLLLDEPFMGLDPLTLTTLSPILHGLAESDSPRLVLTLRPQDPLPEWITHLVFLGRNLKVEFKGRKDSVLDAFSEYCSESGGEDLVKHQLGILNLDQVGRPLTKQGIGKSPIFEENEKISLSEKKKSKGPLGADDDVFASMETQNSTETGNAPLTDDDVSVVSESLIEMEGVHVKYGPKEILGAWNQKEGGQFRSGLWWTVRRGERWGIFGPNGSGKTTVLSLINSDHPQSYSLPIKFFGQSRLPQIGLPGISVFDIQARIGHSSPEIHAVFPRNLTLRQTLENAWADTFLAKPILCFERDTRVDACLRWFRPDLDPSSMGSDDLDRFTDIIKRSTSKTISQAHVLKKKRLAAYKEYVEIDTDWADEISFGDISFSSQRVALFLRAIVKGPDLVILDEAFSGMDERVRDKCMTFLTWGERRFKKLVKLARTKNRFGRTVKSFLNLETGVEEFGPVSMPGLNQDQALICVSHVKEEVPETVKDWICLPETSGGQPARFGRFLVPLAEDCNQWDAVWGM